ncbi:unnamed protein product [Triticum turgidum subsp. durum]|uniref:Uncharacterized protein n=1 Tax=Triticum turgidum subsp. durum TaxID=4567 RepID=A0A9R0QJ45_TRITD|nr:unnamed protein product [Triticum turgidum subsp. durum]
MASSSWKKWPGHVRDKWRDDLRDIDFWFNGYRKTNTYLHLVRQLSRSHHVLWNVGVGPMASFSRAISGMAVEGNPKYRGKHVIKVDLKPTPTAEEAQGIELSLISTKYQLAVAAAMELGLLDQGYNRLKEKHDEIQYYSYGCDKGDITVRLLSYVEYNIVSQIIKQLVNERYLLVAENLQWPIEPGSLTLEDVGLPPPRWLNSQWLISTTSRDVYNKSKSNIDGVISIDEDDQVAVLILFSLHQSAEHILNMMRQESKEYWHHIALQCFHYAMAIFTKHAQVAAITSDELIHHWVAEGILPCMAIKEEEETSTVNSKCSNMHRLGRVIVEAFQKYSLLQLPFSPANDAYEATNTGTQFIAYHDLIAEGITADELFDNRKQMISFTGDHGCHVSREWLSLEENMGATALVLRGCSHQSVILPKLDHLLPNLCFLLVLDLSYTPLKLLPSYIGCLQKLRLLSLRGCHDLKTLSSSSTTNAIDSSTNISSSSPLSTLYNLEFLDMNGVPVSVMTQDVANQKGNLIHLDMSHSEISTFPHNFFADMSNLEELMLTSCSNLVELPPSMASLSSLTTLEVTRTRIKYFPQMIFEEMQKLQSLKLIHNKKLISLTGPISGFQIIKLEGHPNIVSFMLIGTPHIRGFSVRGCRKLESVEIKDVSGLEEIDLSGTSIKELPDEIPNLPQLRRLLLGGVPSLRRFPWHRLVRLPDVFYLDHCSEGNGNHSNQVSHVCVTDPRFFRSFTDTTVNLVRDGLFFQSFYIQVKPCITNSMRLQDEESRLDKKGELLRNQSTYVDVYNSYFTKEIAIASPITVPLHRTERHVDITGMQERHDGLYDLLKVTKSLSVTCDTSIDEFYYLSSITELEECELSWCHKMEVLFRWHSPTNLRNMHVCNLKNLVWFCSQYSSCDFSTLEHLHLEDCPRLEHVVLHGTSLPCLKTLDILFCYNLKTIFFSNNTQVNIYGLPSIQRIRLQELPLLQHFDNKDALITAPVWKELHIRGCWSLRRLPCRQGCLPKTVKVNGERSWWSKLQWRSPLHLDSYDPKLPPEFASFDERAEMSSYLR